LEIEKYAGEGRLTRTAVAAADWAKTQQTLEEKQGHERN
jgi:hypothetical protein